jgi:predicted transcriptional regulator
MGTGLSALIMFLVLSGQQAPVAPGFRAPDFCLQDQQGRDFTLSSQRGRILVLLAGDRAGSEQNRAWGSAIAKRYGQAITIIGIADTRGVPFFLKDRVRKSFDKEPVRMLLDWEGTAFDTYAFLPGTANIVVIDGNGVIRCIHAGGLNGHAEERIMQEIAGMVSRRQERRLR